MAKEKLHIVEEVKEDAPVDDYRKKKLYVEWKVEINGRKYEKLKAGRTVKITDEQAEYLNNDILSGGNKYATMYFPKEI